MTNKRYIYTNKQTKKTNKMATKENTNGGFTKAQLKWHEENAKRNNETKIGDQIPYTIELAFGKGKDKRYGFVIAIADKGDYKKILLDTGHEIYRAN